MKTKTPFIKILPFLAAIALGLSPAAHGGGTFPELISVAPQPFWTTLNLFRSEPKLSLVLLAPGFVAQGQPNYAAVNGVDLSALAGLSPDSGTKFSPLFITPDKTQAATAPVNADPSYAHKSSASSGQSLADHWSQVAGVGSTIPAYSTGFGIVSSGSATDAAEAPQSQAIAAAIDHAPRYAGEPEQAHGRSTALTSTIQQTASGATGAPADSVKANTSQTVAALTASNTNSLNTSSIGATIEAPAAVAQYWDINNTTGLQAGNGDWVNTSALSGRRWQASASPGTATPVRWVQGNDAHFMASGMSLVSVVGTDVQVNSITFDGTGYTIGGAGTLILIGSNITTNADATISAILNGTLGVTKLGNFILTLSGANIYTGGTTLSAGTISLSGSGTLGSTSGALTVNSGTLDLGGTSQTVGAVSGSGGTILNNGGATSLTVGNGGGTGSYAGTIASGTGSLGFVKAGAGTETLTGANSYTGATTVDAGVLELANTGGAALTGTSMITVNSGGTLLMSANNQISSPSSRPVTLAGGKIDAGGFSQGDNATQIGLGALSLNSNSIVDLTLTSLLHFADSNGNSWTGTLSIYDWSGTPVTGNGFEQILFGLNASALTAAQLNQISFYSDNGTTFLGTAIFAPDQDGEIIPFLTPVPEPSTWAAAALALTAIVWTQRRRFIRNPSFVPIA
jgi:autotransporter-associated beta strand protein